MRPILGHETEPKCWHSPGYRWGSQCCPLPWLQSRSPALVPTKGRDKSVHWAQQEYKRKGTRLGETEEAGRGVNHGWSQQGSGGFPRAQQRTPALPVSCRAGEDTAFLGGDGEVGGVWGTPPSAGRCTTVRAKP